MKTYFRSCLCISLLLSAGYAIADDCSSDCSDNGQCKVHSVVSQPDHSAILIHQNQYQNYEYGESDCFSAKLNFTYAFDQSFNEEKNITKALFGNAVTTSTSSSNNSSSSSNKNCDSDCANNQLRIQGSGVNNRASNALIAEQFGLGADTDATVGVDPQIQNHTFNFQMYASLGEILDGLYMQADLPLVHSKWELREDCNNNQSASGAGEQAHIAGCMDSFDQGNRPAIDSVEKALAGQTAFGDKQDSLNWSRIVFNNDDCKDDTKLAGLNFALGYHFCENADYHLSGYAYFSAPTGTEIGSQDNARELFAPVIGSDHWKLGAGLHGHFELYNWDDEHTITAYMQGYAGHMFDNCSTRTFDLQNKELSRYMLVKQFDSDNNYAGKLAPLANFSTRQVETDISVYGEGILELMYSNGCGLDISLGYNIWGQDNEELNCKDGLNKFSENIGLKGCAPVQAITFDANGANVADPANLAGTDLVSTQSNATMFSCPALQTGLNNRQYRPVDNQPSGNAAGDFVNNGNSTDPCIETSQPTAGNTIANLSAIKNSNSPQYLKSSELDTNSGLLPSMVSHRIFGRMNYTFEDVDFSPYVGLGASVAFSDDDHCATSERWSIFFNGGISF